MSVRASIENGCTWPAFGVFAGTACGILANAASNRTLHSKGSAICCILDHPSLASLNAAKQVEVKRAVLFTPCMLAFSSTLYKPFEGEGSGIDERMRRQASRFPWPEAGITCALTALGVVGNELSLGYCPLGFDTSGYIMLRAVSAYASFTAIDYILIQAESANFDGVSSL